MMSDKRAPAPDVSVEQQDSFGSIGEDITFAWHDADRRGEKVTPALDRAITKFLDQIADCCMCPARKPGQEVRAAA